MPSLPSNPVRGALLWVGLVLARLGLLDRTRVVRTTDLAWPRVVTGLARMSKSAVDVAMVGLALGSSAIAGVGFATPYWGLAFALGGGVAGGTISLVSQRYGADRFDELDRSVKASVVVALCLTLPVSALFAAFPTELVALVGTGEAAVAYGATYLRVVALGVPFAALNLVASRTLVGCDDARTPMLVRAGGAVANVGVNALLVFGLGLGVFGAAMGTVLANVLVTLAFAWGLLRGGLPLVGAFPVTLDVRGPHLDWSLARDLTDIATPLVLTNLARIGGQFPFLAVVGLFGEEVAAAFVIALRVRDLLDTPGWGFGLASSSLVGQSLGVGAEDDAASYAQDVLRFALAVYLVAAASVFAVADWVGRLFVADPAVVPLVGGFVSAVCVSVVFYGVTNGATGPLRASGDTRWPLYGQVLGLYGVALPVASLGTTTDLGVTALYLALVLETAVPAAVVYYRYRSGRWKSISRAYRPAAADD
ncbi:MATE family efflux transporter [Halomarina ordinaria]|uniref:Multidrug-efflux transporter n=1 Tax=Halomarina ordinaria TaxID=3033939 RepID=A0ABD5UCU1_9EURY|nr:MATE family efflux transporter [Halomarina sp. PSRA2]